MSYEKADSTQQIAPKKIKAKQFSIFFLITNSSQNFTAALWQFCQMGWGAFLVPCSNHLTRILCLYCILILQWMEKIKDTKQKISELGDSSSLYCMLCKLIEQSFGVYKKKTKFWRPQVFFFKKDRDSTSPIISIKYSISKFKPFLFFFTIIKFATRRPTVLLWSYK